MNSRIAIGIFSCLLTLVLGACSHSGGGGSTNMRVVNAVPDANSITVTVNDQIIVSNLPFQGLTQYRGADSGNQEFKVSANGGTSNAIDTTLSLSNNANYTYIVFNPVSSASAQLIIDSGIGSPPSGDFSIRIINVASGIGPVDVYLTPPGTDLNSTSPTIANTPVGGVSLVFSPAAGALELRATAAGTKDVIYDTPPQAFVSGNIYEAVVLTAGSSKLVNVAMLNIDDAGTGQLNNSLLADFKVLNASQVPSPLNVLVDGALTLSNVPYAAISNYVTIAQGQRTFSVQATATPGANLLNLVTTLAPATDTSIMLNGGAGALQATVLADNNLPPPIGRARIRFVNGSPDEGPLDVYINFSKQVSGLATNAASGYNEVTADAALGTSFEFDFNVAGTTNPVLKLPNVTIIAAHTYTIYVIGLSTGLQGVVVKDD
ncbi:MAG TPA: DUF4397 domain-containing protein [Casimicrobiaceae bacterium]